MIRCGHCKGRHERAAQVRECWITEQDRPRHDDLVERLRKVNNDFSRSLVSFHETRGFLTDKQIAAATGMLEKLETTRVVPEGVHLVDGVVYKVQRAVHGSGRLYGKRFDEMTKRFVRDPKAMRLLSVDTLMPLEEAKRFGKLYGMCMVCGRTLTDETSIERGIGPICEGRF